MPLYFVEIAVASLILYGGKSTSFVADRNTTDRLLKCFNLLKSRPVLTHKMQVICYSIVEMWFKKSAKHVERKLAVAFILNFHRY